MTKTQNSPLKLGFIGGSKYSAVGYAHWCASQLDNCWQVVSGCFSQSLSRSIETAQSWNIPEHLAYAQWQQYIKEQGKHLDAVAVLTPTPEHQPIVSKLLEHNIPVICEKAMAATLPQSKEIKQSLNASKVFLAVTFNYSGFPLVRALRQHILAGDLGKLTQIQIEMPSDGFIQEEHLMHPQKWRLNDGSIPTILLDLGVHLHHLIYFLTGLQPKAINADFHHDSIFDGIVDDAYLWVKYEQDFRANIWLSKTALGHRNGLKLHIYGEKGSALWVEEHPEQLHLFSKNSMQTTYDRGNTPFKDVIVERFKPGHPAGFIEAFANLYQDIAHNLRAYQQQQPQVVDTVFGWEHAHEGLKLFHAANLAHQNRQWINLNEVQ